MIDIHCHILPYVDDGPDTLAASLLLARAMVDDGITYAVATPHVYPGLYNNYRVGIADAVSKLRAALKDASIGLEIGFAGEVRLCPELLDLIERNEIPFLGKADKNRKLLLELPDGQIPNGTISLIRQLSLQAISVIVAHPERNRRVMQEPTYLTRLVDAGAYLQLTAGSIIGEFGRRAQDCAVHAIKSGLPLVVASDCHNLKSRPPRMSKARRSINLSYGDALGDCIFESRPRILLA